MALAFGYSVLFPRDPFWKSICQHHYPFFVGDCEHHSSGLSTGYISPMCTPRVSMGSWSQPTTPSTCYRHRETDWNSLMPFARWDCSNMSRSPHVFKRAKRGAARADTVPQSRQRVNTGHRCAKAGSPKLLFPSEERVT